VYTPSADDDIFTFSLASTTFPSRLLLTRTEIKFRKQADTDFVWLRCQHVAYINVVSLILVISIYIIIHKNVFLLFEDHV